MMEKDIAFNPLQIRFFGADAIMFNANKTTNLVEELRFIHNKIRHGTKLAEFSHGDHFRDMPALSIGLLRRTKPPAGDCSLFEICSKLYFGCSDAPHIFGSSATALAPSIREKSEVSI